MDQNNLVTGRPRSAVSAFTLASSGAGTPTYRSISEFSYPVGRNSQRSPLLSYSVVGIPQQPWLGSRTPTRLTGWRD